MRVPAAALPPLLLLLALAAVPAAAAAGLEPQAPRVQDKPFEPGGATVFEIPVRALQEGSLYAKLLPTPGNAIHDGARANGSATARTGWWAEMAAVLPDGTEQDLGQYHDGTRTPLVPVQEGDVVTFRVTVHVPSDAAGGGKAYVAIAHRLPAAPGAGGSGAELEEARSFTLRLVSDAAAVVPIPATPATPTTPANATPTLPLDPTPRAPTARAPTAAQAQAPASASPFLVLGVVLLGVVVVLLTAIATLLALILRELQTRAAPQGRLVPVRDADAPATREQQPPRP